LISGATLRVPNSARSKPPSSGMPNTQNISTSVFFQLFHML
jgi:hypothetical protein